jgi:hypothetical protein
MTQPYPQYAPGPKKRRKWPIVLLILGVLFVVGIGGCAALLNSASNEAQKQDDRSAPRDVAVGTSFTIGKHQTLAGWKVVNEAGMFSVTGKVKNVSDATSTAFFHLKFLSATGEVLGNVDCNGSDLEPGQSETLNCLPNGKFGKYQKVTAEATF